MSSRSLLLIFSIGLIIYSAYDLKSSYNKFKNEPDSISITIFIKSVGGIVLGAIFLLLYLFGYV